MQRGWSRSRTLSVSYVAGTASPLEQRGSTTQVWTWFMFFFFNLVIFFSQLFFPLNIFYFVERILFLVIHLVSVCIVNISYLGMNFSSFFLWLSCDMLYMQAGFIVWTKKISFQRYIQVMKGMKFSLDNRFSLWDISFVNAFRETIASSWFRV